MYINGVWKNDRKVFRWNSDCENLVVSRVRMEFDPSVDIINWEG